MSEIDADAFCDAGDGVTPPDFVVVVIWMFEHCGDLFELFYPAHLRAALWCAGMADGAGSENLGDAWWDLKNQIEGAATFTGALAAFNAGAWIDAPCRANIGGEK